MGSRSWKGLALGPTLGMGPTLSIQEGPSIITCQNDCVGGKDLVDWMTWIGR